MQRITLFLLLVVFLALTVLSQLFPALPQFAFGLFNPESSETVAYAATGTELVFVGDILLARNVERLMDRHGTAYPWQRLPDFSAEQVLVGNFEASVPPVHTPTPDFTFSFSVATSVLPGLTDAGFNLLSLANNHSYDTGAAGYQHTHSALSAAGLTAWGDQSLATTTAVRYVEIDSKTVALIALYAVSSRPNESALAEVFAATAQADRRVVFVHWGTEYELQASSEQRALAQTLAAFGADLIVGHHPHVVQEIERIDDTVVVYSLGNFVFDQYFSAAVQEGLMINLSFWGTQNRLVLEPITSIDQLSSPRVMTKTEAETFLASVATRSDEGLAAQVAAGEIVW